MNRKLHRRLRILRAMSWLLFLIPVASFLAIAWATRSDPGYSEHNSIEQRPRTYYRLRVTAYCACRKCCGKWAKYNLTSSGSRPVRLKTVATDTSVIPHGSVLRIPGVGIVVSRDTGSEITDGDVDLYMGDASHHGEALQWGVKYLDVEVISKGKNDKGTAAREIGERARRRR